jgi:hypothetical protein
MDTTSVREVVKEVIQEYAALRLSHGEIRLDSVLDETHDRYALLQVGWDRGRRIRGLLLYLVVLSCDADVGSYSGKGSGTTSSQPTALDRSGGWRSCGVRSGAGTHHLRQ